VTHPPCDRVVVAFELNARPHPKGRPRFGKGRAFTDDKTRAYENDVRAACVAAMAGATAYGDDVELVCLFEQRDGRAADLDNLVKAVSDGIDGYAFVNDRQVVRLTAARALRAGVDRVSVAVLAVTA
jgi:crossover junction endodeoxyribonuclease RusA